MADEPNNPIDEPSETPESAAADSGAEQADIAPSSAPASRRADEPDAQTESPPAAPPQQPVAEAAEAEQPEAPAQPAVAHTPGEAEAVEPVPEPETPETVVKSEATEATDEPRATEEPAVAGTSEPVEAEAPPEAQTTETPADAEAPPEAQTTQTPAEAEAPSLEQTTEAPAEAEATETSAEPEPAETKVEAAPSEEPSDEEASQAPADEQDLADAVTEQEEKSDHMDWYILKVQSNREESIREGLLRRVAIAGLDRYFGEIIVPMEQVTEFKAGKKRVTKRKLYPGYLVVQMEINDDTWFLVRETPGIGDFTGAAGHPTPMQPHEVARILAKQEEKGEEAPKLKIAFHTGDKVKINEGTFENFEGEIDRIDQTSGRVTVLITIFGRPTPVELEYWQIETV